MKIVHVLDHSIPLHSGYSFRTRAILNNQRLQGIQTCHVTSPKQGPCDALEEVHDQLKFYRSPSMPRWLARIPLLNQLAVIPLLKRRLLEVIAKEQPDIIHAHSPALNGMAALWAARKTGLPLVYEVRAFWEDAAVNLGSCRANSLRYQLSRALETYILRRADAITCICEGLKTDIVARGVNEAKITTIPNAVDLEQFSLLTEKSPQLLQDLALEGKQVIGFIGSFYDYEGLDLLVRSLSLLANRLPNLRLLLVGGGPQDAQLKALVRELDLRTRVIFTGRVPHQAINDYYSLIDLLVYPRKSMRLTELVTPLKPMEAMAQGKPVLASNVGGHRELIEDQDNGFLFRADDPNHLAECIAQLMAANTRRTAIIAKGLDFVKQERNWSCSVRRYHPIYQALVH
ncbi:MAG: PEP-CTERM/exosortase A-associated glycosyltransferase [Motiliproteus sp.]|jgi:PEP-CTERM/exosortase A-associated glycosyltransferase